MNESQITLQTINQASDIDTVIGLIKSRPKQEVKRRLFDIAEELDNMGEQIQAKKVRGAFWSLSKSIIADVHPDQRPRFARIVPSKPQIQLIPTIVPGFQTRVFSVP